jgi:hypothetical protein
MHPGTVEQARTLAVERWARLHTFDLELSQWDEFFRTNHVCDVLEAIALTKKTHSKDPAVIYSHFEKMMAHLTKKRYGAA